MKISKKYLYFGLLPTFLLLANCNDNSSSSYPKTNEDRRKDERGKLTGDGLSLFGNGSDDNSSSNTGIGINAILWRATLDSLAFMPLNHADPFGGIIITDWYEDPKHPNERYKINAYILDKELRADAIKIAPFKQYKSSTGQWTDAAVDNKLARDLENAILTRARELKVKQIKN